MDEVEPKYDKTHSLQSKIFSPLSYYFEKFFQSNTQHCDDNDDEQ